jgi:Xaa-Pro aminopeptidase
MCFSDEPEIYIHVEFGMRKEDSWYVTGQGSKLITVLAESIDNPI